MGIVARLRGSRRPLRVAGLVGALLAAGAIGAGVRVRLVDRKPEVRSVPLEIGTIPAGWTVEETFRCYQKPYLSEPGWTATGWGGRLTNRTGMDRFITIGFTIQAGGENLVASYGTPLGTGRSLEGFYMFVPPPEPRKPFAFDELVRFEGELESCRLDARDEPNVPLVLDRDPPARAPTSPAG